MSELTCADFHSGNVTHPSSLWFQDLSCIDDLSNNSLFSSPADSLSEYADTQAFIGTDSLATVPTLWDVSTSTTTTPAQSQLEVSSTHARTWHHQKCCITKPIKTHYVTYVIQTYFCPHIHICLGGKSLLNISKLHTRGQNIPYCSVNSSVVLGRCHMFHTWMRLDLLHVSPFLQDL